MPRIPNYEAAGTSVPRANTPRFPADRSVGIEAEGQEALLGAVGAAVDKAVEHDDQLRYAAARTTLLKAQAEVRKELESDADYETFEKRYIERIAKARAAAASNIRGARSRGIFEAAAQADVERGVEQIRALARGVETRQGIATLNDTLETVRNQALESKDEAERIALLENANEAITGALKRRYIDEEQARDARTKFATNFSEAFVGIQTPAERIAMLEKPENNFAKFIAPDRRKELLEAAKKDNDEVRVRGESQAVFDSLMAKYGTDFKGALREAREELKADPKLRDATEDRIREEQVAAATFERADSEAAAMDAMQFLISGGPDGKPGKLSDLPLDLKNRMKPQAQVALKNFALSGGRTVSDPAALVELSQLASDPQNFAYNVDMMKFRPLLTDADFNKNLNLQRQYRTGELDSDVSGFFSINQVRDAKLNEFFGGTKTKKAGKAGEAEQAVINGFVTKFEAALRGFKGQNGGKATPDDARKILDQMWSEVVISEGFIDALDTKKRVYELTDEDVKVPEAWRRLIIEALQRAGQPVTKEAIESRYKKSNPATPIVKPAPAAAPPPPRPRISDAVDEVRKSEAEARKPKPRPRISDVIDETRKSEAEARKPKAAP